MAGSAPCSSLPPRPLVIAYFTLTNPFGARVFGWKIIGVRFSWIYFTRMCFILMSVSFTSKFKFGTRNYAPAGLKCVSKILHIMLLKQITILIAVFPQLRENSK